MSPQGDIFSNAIEHFAAEQEEMRAAAAFAAGTRYLSVIWTVAKYQSLGNIAIGNLQLFLPVIVRMVESDQKKRLLSLHALKEVKFRCFPSLSGIDQV
jgi:cullin-associated NEDD8-dissociated protein 1